MGNFFSPGLELVSAATVNNADLSAHVFTGLSLFVAGLVALVIALKQGRRRGVRGRYGLPALAIIFMVGGVNQVVSSSFRVRGELSSLLEHVVLSIFVTIVVTILPWAIVRMRYARKTIRTLKGEIESTGRMADEVKAQQKLLSRHIAEKSDALVRTTEEAFRFAALVRSSKDAVIGINEDGSVWHWNPAAEYLFKIPAEAVVGRSLEIVGVGKSGNLWKEVKRMERLPMLRGQTEASVRCGDGTLLTVWLSVSSMPKQARDGGGYAIFARDLTDKKLIEERISEALIEKEVLLKEIHHRVKNNLQLICSLLRLQSKETSDQEALRLLRKSEERVRALAIVHDRLYRASNLSTINFSSYLRDLVDALVKSASAEGNPLSVEYDMIDLELPIDSAIICGLIVNELVTNCVKHTPADGEGVAVRLRLKRQDSSVLISVWNRGKEDVDAESLDRPRTLGLNLVRALTRQLGGEITRSYDGGVTFSVTLPPSILTAKGSSNHAQAA